MPFAFSLPTLFFAVLVQVFSVSDLVASVDRVPGDICHVSELRRDAFAAVKAGQPDQAIQIYLKALQQLKQCPDIRAEALILANLTGLHSSRQRFAGAIELANKGIAKAREAQDRESVAILLIQKASSELNLALYEAARETVKTADALVLQPDLSGFQPDLAYLNAQLAVARRQGTFLEMVAFRRALKIATEKGNRRIQVRCWEKLGIMLSEADRWEDARQILNTAISELGHENLSPGLLRNLALLQNHDGLRSKALQTVSGPLSKMRTDPTVWLPRWQLLGVRARIFLGAGLRSAAVADYERAFSEIDLMRQPLGLQVEDEREVLVNRLYMEYADLVLENGRQPNYRQAIKLVQLLDSNRARSLGARQAELGAGSQGEGAYYQALAEFRKIETAPGQEAKLRRQQLLAQLEVHESDRLRGGDNTPLSNDRLSNSGIGGIPEKALVLVFTKISEKNLTLTALTGGRAHVTWLGRAGDLADEVTHFRRMIERDDPGAFHAAERLFVRIFGQIPGQMLNQQRWFVVPDGPIFGAPLAAFRLPPSGNQAGKYLIEDRSIQILPRLGGWLNPSSKPLVGTLSLMADPIYNRQDERRSRQKPPTGAPDMEFSRLVGSGREAKRIEQIWSESGLPVRSRYGAEVNYGTLVQEMSGDSSVLHLAMHAREDDDRSAAKLAIGLSQRGYQEYLSGTSFVGRRIGPHLVVMNGCQTGVGNVTPTGGLQGLVRDWLLGGADAVVATHWKTRDTSGALFEEFYRELSRNGARKNGTPAVEALRVAQVRMIRKGGWHSKPRHWAAFFLMGRS